MKKTLFSILFSLAIAAHVIAEPEKREIISLETLVKSEAYTNKTPREIYQELHEANIISSDNISIIKFFMPNCGECLSVKLPFEKVMRDMKEIYFYEANCDSPKLEAIADAFEIEKVPAFIVIHKGKEIGRFLGVYSYTDLKKEIAQILEKNNEQQISEAI